MTGTVGKRGPRITARTRLSLVYATLFALSGAVLSAVVIGTAFAPGHSATAGTRQSVSYVPKPVDPARLAVRAKQEARRELRERLVITAGAGVAGMTLVSAGLGWVMAGRVLRPVRAVSGAARRLSRYELHQRIPVAGPHDEMRELAETFNAMLARLEQSFAAQQRFAANASHELRGPITTMRTLVDVATPARVPAVPCREHDEPVELADALRGQLDRQQRLVDGLLDLARSENGSTTIAPVRLDVLAREALVRSAPAIDRRGIVVSRALEPGRVHGDPVLLELLVDNLIRNAVDHNRGGYLRVAGSAGRLVVENSGDEIGASRLAELREPFRRGPRDRLHGGGTGLGLAIADAVALAHDATLTLTPRPGGGVRAELTVPARTPPEPG